MPISLMNVKHYIQLVGFDGRDYWRLFYIEIRDSNEIYYGFVSKKMPLHFSRHGSGQLNVKVGKEKRKITDIMQTYKLKPLSDLNGMESLGTFSPLPDNKIKLSENEYKKYISKKCSGIFLIDLRNYDGTLNVQVAIVNPSYKDSITKNYLFGDDCQVYIYTSSNPWVVFYIWNVQPKSV